MNTPSSFWRNALLLSGLLLIAVNLRPAITGIAPLAERMNNDGLSVQIIGLLTTAPLILFGAAGLFVGAIGGRIGFARALGLGLVILSLGCFLRSWDFGESDRGRIIGSILIGTGIAFGNVLMPGIVKSRFPHQMGLMTSLYSTAMNLGGALGIALAVPLALSLGGGWNSSLGAWGYAALLPLILWIPQIINTPAVRHVGNPFTGIMQLLGSVRAWQVTAQMGLQSLLFYSSVAWLPTILQLRGMSESASYGWPTAMQIGGCVASLTIPTLAGRARSQSPWVMSCSAMTIVGICGILWLPLPWVGAATIILGLGLNAGFSMSLLLIAMRSRDAETAGNLSSMAQSIGYLAAAPFPWFIGWLHSATESWTLAYGFLLVPGCAILLAGALAGRVGFVK
ncbi:MFS transporter [Verrucomicrobiaceae bacterium 227]